MSNGTEAIRIAGIVRDSIVDGPGFRFVVFAQGCPHHCEGCHNPDTHDFAGGYSCDLSKIIDAIEKEQLISGVTFSGGEPFCQPEAFYALAVKLKEKNMHLMSFTGYTYEELIELGKKNEHVFKLLGLLDLLIDGRFHLAEKDLTLTFRGSQNQRFIDLNQTRKTGSLVEIL